MNFPEYYSELGSPTSALIGGAAVKVDWKKTESRDGSLRVYIYIFFFIVNVNYYISFGNQFLRID